MPDDPARVFPVLRELFALKQSSPSRLLVTHPLYASPKSLSALFTSPVSISTDPLFLFPQSLLPPETINMSEPKKPEEVELTVMKPPPPSSQDSPTSPVDSEDEDSAEQPAAKAQDFVLPRFDFERPQRFMDPERYLIEIIQHVQDDDDEMVEDGTGEVDNKSSSSG